MNLLNDALAFGSLFIHNFATHLPSLNPVNWVASLFEAQAYLTENLGEGAPSLDSLSYCLVFIAILALVRLLSEKIIFMPLGLYLGKVTHSEKWVERNPHRIHKFSEISFKFLFHASMSYWALGVLADKPWFQTWFQSTDQCWHNYPLQPVDDDMKLFYMLQLSYHTMIMFWHFFEVRRDDFVQMFVHHVTTVCLVFFSYLINFVRIGSLVFLVHDLSDIPASLVKLTNYMKWNKLTVVFFLSTLASWAYFRLYIFPVSIINSALFESLDIVTDYSKQYGWFFFNGMMVLLLALHVIWFAMFLKILYTLVFKKETHDLTEHNKGEKEH